MISPLKLRPAEFRDMETLVAFNIAMALETEQKKLDPATVFSGVAAVLDHPELGIYHVAERDGQVIAQLLVTYEWSDWRNGMIHWVQSVFVHPDHRRTGVFRELQAHVRRTAQEDEAAGLRLYVERNNVDAQAVYHQLGMRDAGYIVMEELFADSAE